MSLQLFQYVSFQQLKVSCVWGGSILGAGFSSTVSVCVDSEVEFAKVEGGSLREPGETDDDAPATAKDGSSAWGEGLADLAEATATDGSSAWGEGLADLDEATATATATATDGSSAWVECSAVATAAAAAWGEGLDGGTKTAGG